MNKWIRFAQKVKGKGVSCLGKCFALNASLHPQKEMELDDKDRLERKAKLEELFAENDIALGKKGISDYYYDEPIDEKLILLLGLGKSVRGNMQYILNELNASPRFKGYKIRVRTSAETEETVWGYIEKNHWRRTKPVTKESSYRKAMETAKYLITEVYFPEGWVKRPEQVYINIWHGTPLKKLGQDKKYAAMHSDGITQRNFIDAKYLLYPNDYTRDHMLKSYRVQNLMRGKTLMLGYPRTGGMLAAAQEDLTELKAQLAPQGERIYAYMPTWKDYLPVETVVAESRELLTFLDEHLSDDRILYVNLHHKVSDSIDYSGFRRVKKFPADVDSYRLLAATEALITDYSSVFYDYLALRRQIILYCADYEEYKQGRGTYMDLDELPFDKALTKEEVLAAIERGKTYDDSAAFARFCNYDSTENARLLCSALLGEKEVADRVAPIPAVPERSVLIYDEHFGDKKGTRLLDDFVNGCAIRGDGYYVSCNSGLTDEDKKSAYPFLYDVSVIGTCENIHFGKISKGAISLYEQGKLDSEALRDFLKYDYYLCARRWFGRAKFDVEIIFDVADAHRLYALLAVPAKRLLFLSDDAVQKLSDGDELFRGAVCYAIDHCMGVFTTRRETKLAAQKLLPQGTDITVIENAGQLQKLLKAEALNKKERVMPEKG